MRPRLITAENTPHAAQLRPEAKSFNEAAAHHRGEHGCRGWPAAGCACFNEAAAHHRGEPGRADLDALPEAASMRPRLITAENSLRTRVLLVDGVASMRPRLITAENGDEAEKDADKDALQ